MIDESARLGPGHTAMARMQKLGDHVIAAEVDFSEAPNVERWFGALARRPAVEPALSELGANA